MSFVIINPEKQAEIDALVATARKHCVPWSALAPTAVLTDNPMLSLADRKSVPPRFEPRHLMVGNVMVAFSFEEQPAGICRHLSVSVERKGMLPHEAAVAMIAEAFGFTAFPPRAGRVWVEEFEPGHHAINVVEVAEPTAGPELVQ